MNAAAFVALLALAAPAGAATPDDLLEAVRRGDLTGVKAALDAGVAVDTPFRYERTALSFAADRGNLEIARLLLERGADPNKKDSFYGATPMTWASDKANVAMARLLIEHGAQAGADLLDDAVDKGSSELVTLALEKAKLGADDLSGALAAATEAKNDVIVEQLRKAGALPLKPADFVVDPATLARYAGSYRADNGNEMRFEVRDAKLVCISCARGGMVLGALDAVTFRQQSRPKPKVVFTLTEGVPSGCLLDFGDLQLSYRRAAADVSRDVSKDVSKEAPKEKP